MAKKSYFFRGGLLVISIDLFYHLGQLPGKLISDFKMSLSSMKQDSILTLSLSSSTFDYCCLLLLLFVKDSCNLSTDAAIFFATLLMCSWSSVSLAVVNLLLRLRLKDQFLNIPPNELLLSLALCLTGLFIFVMFIIPFIWTEN